VLAWLLGAGLLLEGASGAPAHYVASVRPAASMGGDELDFTPSAGKQ